MGYNFEQICRQECYFKSVLYMVQSLTDINIQQNLIERMLHTNLYFSIRIAHHCNMTQHFRSIFHEQLQKSLEFLKEANEEIDEIITPLYIALVLQEEESIIQLTNVYLIPLLHRAENQHLNDTFSIMYDSLGKEHLIKFFSILCENQMFKYIDPNRIYGRCSEEEKSILRSMLLTMSQEKDRIIMQKMVLIGFQCQIDGLFPQKANRKLFKLYKYYETWSIAMKLYYCYGILNGNQIPNNVFRRIIKDGYIVNTVELYDFLTEYALHYSIPDEVVYALIVKSRVTKEPMLQECVKKIAEGSTHSKLTLQMQQNLKISDFYTMCRNPNYTNVVQFMIQNNPDNELRQRYFSALAHSNIYLAASVISSTYYNFEPLENLFDLILCKKMNYFYGNAQEHNYHSQELMNIVAALLILERYDEFEKFMQDVFCPFILNNRTKISWFSNHLSADLLFILICSMAINKAASKISPSLICEYKVIDKKALSTLLKKVYYDNDTRIKTNSLHLIILMVEKYGIENLADLLETTDDLINDRIHAYFKKKPLSLTNSNHLLYLSFLVFRKPFKQLNEQELNLLDKYAGQFANPYSINDFSPKKLRKIISKNIFKSDQDIQDGFLSFQPQLKCESSFNERYLQLLQDENQITALLNQYSIAYNANWNFRKWGKIDNNPERFFESMNIIFESYQNVYNIIRVFFSLLQLYSFPLEAVVRYLYEKRGKDNDYLRFLLNDVVLSGSVKKSTDRCIYVYPASFLSVNSSLQIIWCDGKVHSGSEEVVPMKKEWIYCKIHSYDPINNSVLLRCPSYSLEECLYYNKKGRMDKRETIIGGSYGKGTN